MSAPRLTGDRLAVVYGYSLPEGAHPVEGERVSIDAGGERPVEAINAGEIVGLPRHGFDLESDAPHLLTTDSVPARAYPGTVPGGPG